MKKSTLILLALVLFIFTQHTHAQCGDLNQFTITTSTGNWAEEMSWVLYDNNNTVIDEFQGIGGFNYTEYTEELCLEYGCYIIEALDSWGDGWNGGEIIISIQNNNTGETSSMEYSLNSNSIGYYEIDFLATEDCIFNIFGCMDPSAVNYNEFATEDDGTCIITQEFYVTGHPEMREYLFYKPENAAAQAPLVFVAHGYSGSADDIMNFTGFIDLADEHGFAVCYPQGTKDSDNNAFWNVGYAFTANETVDDVKFFTELATHLQTTYDLSPEKTFCTGNSNGGEMCYLLACEASETFSAFGSVSGTMFGGLMNNCSSTNHVSILEIHGTEDNVTYYDGDLNDTFWGPYPGQEEVINFWVENNNCTLNESFYFPNTNTNDGSQVYVERYYSNSTNSAIWLYKVEGGGHDWPGSWGNMDINASEEIWNFFQLSMNQSLNVIEPVNKEMPKVLYSIDVLGRNITKNAAGVIIDVFDDGSTQKRIVLKANQ